MRDPTISTKLNTEGKTKQQKTRYMNLPEGIQSGGCRKDAGMDGSEGVFVFRQPWRLVSSRLAPPRPPLCSSVVLHIRGGCPPSISQARRLPVIEWAMGRHIRDPARALLYGGLFGRLQGLSFFMSDYTFQQQHMYNCMTQ